jgi:hypothetical protein
VINYAEIKTQHIKHITPECLHGNPMREKTLEHLSLFSFVSTNLQFIIIHPDRNPSIIDNDTNPLRHQPVADNEDANPLRH